MAVTDGDGRVLFRSPTGPGGCAGMTHARRLGLVRLVAGGPVVEILADAGTRAWGTDWRACGDTSASPGDERLGQVRGREGESVGGPALEHLFP